MMGTFSVNTIDDDNISSDDDNISSNYIASPGLTRSRFYRARMEEALKECWSYQKLMQSAQEAIIADLMANLNSRSAVARQQRIENVAALDCLSAQLKENMYLLEALQEITREFLAQSMQRFAEAAKDLESWRAQHPN
jgi:hypothetical protein